MTSEWECMNCGYLEEGKLQPVRCPDCGAGDAWEKVACIYFGDAWECGNCQYFCEQDPLPPVCPECGATDAWEKVELAEEQESDGTDSEDLSENQQAADRAGGNGPRLWSGSWSPPSMVSP
jgi:rubrerythrin